MTAKKIKISLDFKEFNTLMSLLSEQEIKAKKSLLFTSIEIPLKKKLIESLDEEQAKEYIRAAVKEILSRATGIPASNIDDKDELEADLHMNSMLIRSLAVPFTALAREFNSDAIITPDECEECDTVDDCVKLVIEKSKTE